MADKKKGSFLSRTADIFDLPAEAMAGDFKITVTGSRRLIVENHRGLMEYGENEIDINCGKSILKIRGDELEIRAMNSDELLITGVFFGIEF